MHKKSSIFDIPVFSLADRAGTRRLAKILARGIQNAPDIEKRVVTILDDVKKRGDRAVLAHTEKYDGVRIAASDLLVSSSEMESAFKSLPKPAKKALQTGLAGFTLNNNNHLGPLRTALVRSWARG